MSLFGRTIHVAPRNGSTVNSQTSSPVNTPNPHGQWTQGQMNSPPYSPQMQRPSFGSPDNMQKQVLMSNIMLQIQMSQMQQLQQQNGSLLGAAPLQQQRQQHGSGGAGGYGGSILPRATRWAVTTAEA